MEFHPKPHFLLHQNCFCSVMELVLGDTAVPAVLCFKLKTAGVFSPVDNAVALPWPQRFSLPSRFRAVSACALPLLFQ